MSLEDNNDNIPVKDTYEEKVRGNNPKITRNEIEDRYLHVSEENLILKKHLRKQEDKIKQLATKLVRLVGDRNNRERRGDILLEDQKYRITELELQVNSLRDKLLVARQQLGSYTKLVPGFHKQIKNKRIRTIPTPTVHINSDSSTIVTEHFTNLLLEARAENQALKDRLHILHGHMSSTELELSQLQEQITLKEVERQDEMMTIRSQVELENECKKKKLADNVQMIRLQRDSKRTASWLSTYEAQCRTLETNLNSANETLGQVEYQLSEVQEELRQEQHKSLGLRKQIEDFSSVANQLKEVETRLISLQDENKILKEGHESLVIKALENGDKIKKVEMEENSYKNQIIQLENSIRGELQSKTELIATLNQEKAKFVSIEKGFRELENKYEQVVNNFQITQNKLDEAENKLSEGKPIEIKLPDSCEGCGRLETDFNEVQWQFIQVKEELIKTKNLLKTQISINKEYQKEIEILSTKLEKSEVFHHNKLQDFMRILEERADQMTLLEKNLESFALRPVTPPVLPLKSLLNTDHLQPIVSTESMVNLNDQNSEIGLMNKDLTNFPIGELDSQLKSQKSSEIIKLSSDLNTSNKITSDIVEPVSEIQIVLPLPKLRSSKDKVTVPIQIQSNLLEIQTPTVEIYINKYIPTKGTVSEKLFVTWEIETGRNYSPVVSNGIFNTKSKHILKENFPLEGIEVQLHQADGPLHCRMLATAFIVVGSNVSVAMHSVDGDKILGDLVYSCVMMNEKQKNEFETVSLNNGDPDSDFQNNNIEMKEKLALEAPVPVPRLIPRNHSNQPQPDDFLKGEDEDEAEHLLMATKNRRTSKQKSILRRDGSFGSPKHEGKHVSVNDLVDEREIPNEIHEVEQAHSPFDIVDENIRTNEEFENERLSKIPEESSVVSSINEQRKKHRRRKPKIRVDIEEDSQMTYSLESGTDETSRNVSEIESLEEEYSQTGMRFEISYVQFNEKCRMWNDPKVKKFFVEYNFLNYPSEELETETSLHKPQPGHRAEFNFVKVFLIDTAEKRKLLKEMLKERKRLRFTLVSEPSEDDTIDCEDLGYSYVCFNDILQDDTDIIEEEIPIYDAENHRIQIGVICVSVQAIQVLKTL